MRVSCICPTYNRAPDKLWLLEEAIASFLLQDHPDKELLILDDTPGQELVVDAPDVVVVNSPRRAGSVGEKRAFLVALATGDAIACWDDDDISLPWRLSSSVAQLGNRPYWTPDGYWELDQGQLRRQAQEGVGHSCGIYRRDAYYEVGGYPPLGNGDDTVLHERLMAISPPLTPSPPEQWSYLYRWDGSDTHVSALWDPDVPDDPHVGYEVIGRLPIVPGRYELRPHWRADYQQLIARALLSGRDPYPVTDDHEGSPEPLAG